MKREAIKTYDDLLAHQKRGGLVYYGRRLVSRRYFQGWPSAQIKAEIDRGRLFKAEEVAA